jgi:hypothetical protein
MANTEDPNLKSVTEDLVQNLSLPDYWIKREIAEMHEYDNGTSNSRQQAKVSLTN